MNVYVYFNFKTQNIKVCFNNHNNISNNSNNNNNIPTSSYHTILPFPSPYIIFSLTCTTQPLIITLIITWSLK